MVLSHLGIEPQTVAHHISIRDRLKGLGSTDIDITTHHHRMDAFRGHRHQLLIQWQLQGQQVLAQALSPFPTEHWNRCENLS